MVSPFFLRRQNYPLLSIVPVMLQVFTLPAYPDLSRFIRIPVRFLFVWGFFFRYSADKPFFPYCISGFRKRVAPVPCLFLVPLVPLTAIIVSVHGRMRRKEASRFMNAHLIQDLGGDILSGRVASLML
jgi:hypothetical protein